MLSFGAGCDLWECDILTSYNQTLLSGNAWHFPCSRTENSVTEKLNGQQQILSCWSHFNWTYLSSYYWKNNTLAFLPIQLKGASFLFFSSFLFLIFILLIIHGVWVPCSFLSHLYFKSFHLERIEGKTHILHYLIRDCYIIILFKIQNILLYLITSQYVPNLIGFIYEN